MKFIFCHKFDLLGPILADSFIITTKQFDVNNTQNSQDEMISLSDILIIIASYIKVIIITPTILCILSIFSLRLAVYVFVFIFFSFTYYSIIILTHLFGKSNIFFLCLMFYFLVYSLLSFF